jgi:hypothetical protein
MRETDGEENVPSFFYYQRHPFPIHSTPADAAAYDGKDEGKFHFDEAPKWAEPRETKASDLHRQYPRTEQECFPPAEAVPGNLEWGEDDKVKFVGRGAPTTMMTVIKPNPALLAAMEKAADTKGSLGVVFAGPRRKGITATMQYFQNKRADDWQQAEEQ